MSGWAGGSAAFSFSVPAIKGAGCFSIFKGNPTPPTTHKYAHVCRSTLMGFSIDPTAVMVVAAAPEVKTIGEGAGGKKT